MLRKGEAHNYREHKDKIRRGIVRRKCKHKITTWNKDRFVSIYYNRLLVVMCNSFRRQQVVTNKCVFKPFY